MCSVCLLVHAGGAIGYAVGRNRGKVDGRRDDPSYTELPRTPRGVVGECAASLWPTRVLVVDPSLCPSRLSWYCVKVKGPVTQLTPGNRKFPMGKMHLVLHSLVASELYHNKVTIKRMSKPIAAAVRDAMVKPREALEREAWDPLD